MNKIIRIASVIFFAGTSAFLGGCTKDFDQPPGPADQPIVANTTIASLKALHTVSGQLDQITANIIISGVVTANDQSGNFYKQIFIEDSTGALQILIEATGLYTSYPVGRRVYVNCKGLYITDYFGVMELGVRAVVSGIPSMQGILSSDLSTYIKGGSLNNPVVPTTVTLSQLGTGMQDPNMGRLIKMESFEFAPHDTLKTYSDTSAYRSTTNDTIQNCSGSKTIIRTSAYADFAGLSVPKGNGSVTAIYTVYRTTKQFLIRDTSDVQFNGDRCGSTPPNPASRITIAALRALYSNGNQKITNSTSIGGVVISDAANKNISTGAVVLQEGNAGIVVYIGGTITYNVGDSIILDITNDSLILYRGYLELKTASGTVAPSPIATGRTVTPQVKTISEITAALNQPLYNPANLENTLVRVVGATASGNATLSGNNTLTDNGGNMTLYTSATALFSSTPLPTGPKTWTGYTQKYNGTTAEFLMRNASDVQ